MKYRQMNNKKVTTKQKQAISFVESMLNIQFKGNINNFQDVYMFLNRYLDQAKEMYQIALENSSIIDKDYYE